MKNVFLFIGMKKNVKKLDQYDYLDYKIELYINVPIVKNKEAMEAEALINVAVIYTLDDLDENGEIPAYKSINVGTIQTTNIYLQRIKKGNHIYSFKNRITPIIPTVPKLLRYYKSFCIICDTVDHSFNKDRKCICGSCKDLIKVRSAVLVISNKHREYKKRMNYSKLLFFYMLKKIQNTYDKDFNSRSEWVKMIYHVFGKIPLQVNQYILSYI